MRPLHGGVPERPKGTGCKPVGSAYGGSNPAPIIRTVPKSGLIASATLCAAGDRASTPGAWRDAQAVVVVWPPSDLVGADVRDHEVTARP